MNLCVEALKGESDLIIEINAGFTDIPQEEGVGPNPTQFLMSFFSCIGDCVSKCGINQKKFRTNLRSLLPRSLLKLKTKRRPPWSQMKQIKKLKRGDWICYNGSPGNFLTYTPSKTNGNVILHGDNTRPLRIPLIDIHPGRKLPFDGQYFIVAGKFCQVSTLPCWHNTGLNNTNFNRLTHCMSTK